MKGFFPSSFDFKQQITPDERIVQLRILRGLGFVVHLAILVSHFILFPSQGGKVFIYYTTWGVAMTMLAFGFSLISTFFDDSTPARKHYHKFCYVVFEAVWTSEAVITIFFWLVLTWVIPKELWSFGMVVYMIDLHIYPFALLVVDMFMTRILFRMCHVVFIMIPPIMYMFLSIYLSLAHNIVAYPVLTWKDIITVPSAIILVALFIGSVSYTHLTLPTTPYV
eukprot:TRINITY_DN7830_c0_g2_i2.p1 TRINITY_DN7830_c0_g2~~TRINITY_DN7830_c0_g2_i2.p1  ORF type:complete len:223 (-),score=42.50 TRINITY_DN7830_c0_g2_i2:47-715(-)